MFSDDTIITTSPKNMEEQIDTFKTVVDEFNSRCQRNKLILNKTKSLSVKCHSRRNNADVTNTFDDIQTLNEI